MMSQEQANEQGSDQLGELRDIITPGVVIQLEQIRNCVPDSFFYNIVTNTENRVGSQILEYGDELRFSELEETTDRYVRNFQDRGYYNKYLAHLLTNYRIDESTCDEMVLCAIWKSIYVVPWDMEDLTMRRVHAYIYTTLGQFSRNHMQRTALPGDFEGLYDHDFRLRSASSEFGSPGLRLVQKEELEMTIASLLDSAGMKDDEYLGEYMFLRRRMLQLFAFGYSIEDVVEELGLKMTTAQKWVKRFKGCGANGKYEMGKRVQTRTDGTWRWTEHTARVLLSEGSVLSMLIENEVLALLVLAEEGTLTRTQDSGRLGSLNARKLFQMVRVKVQSNGRRNTKGETTWLAKRRAVLGFLGTVTLHSRKDIAICRALKDHQGSQSDAARSLRINKNQVTYFLERHGFYRN